MTGGAGDKRLHILIEIDGDTYFDQDVVVSSVRFSKDNATLDVTNGSSKGYMLTGEQSITIDYRAVIPQPGPEATILVEDQERPIIWTEPR